MKTVKQIADEIGVSRQAVYKKIKQLNLSTSLQDKLTVDSKQVYMSTDNETVIRQAFKRKNLSTVNCQPVNNKLSTNEPIYSLINTLREQLKVKDEQITEQQRTIRELTAALENTTTSLKAAQALHAGTMKRQLTDSSTEQDTPESGKPTQQPGTGFFSRLFKRRQQP